MPDTPTKYFLTTPIYYVNARPHIGHAYTTIVADVLARRSRAQGIDTFFLTGTDEHGQKIERSAQAAGIEPQPFTDLVSEQFRMLWDRMGLTYDKFIRTTAPEHKRGVQKLFETLYESGFIYLSKYTGSYCVSDEAFVDQPAGTPCPDCGRPLETVTEENFFFKLSEFQKPILDLIESNELLIEPATARNEVLSFMRGADAQVIKQYDQKLSGDESGSPTPIDVGPETPLEGKVAFSKAGNVYLPGALKDLSISRSSFTWGVPVPEPAASTAAQKHVIYVWLDALANYMTALGYGSDDESKWEHYWPADLHLVGKEITRFHCVYWPAFLMAAGIATPKRIVANGWLLFDNSKMSKSKGNVVRTETILDAFGTEVYAGQFPESTKQEQDLFASDILRYYLLREIPFGQDGSFSFESLITRYNADLANGYGNLVSRTLGMIEQNFVGEIPAGKFDETVSIGIKLCVAANQKNWDKLDFASLLENTSTIIKIVDTYLTRTTPWKLAKDPARRSELADILYTAYASIEIVTEQFAAVLPDTTRRVVTMLGKTRLGPLGPIFPRADKGLAQIMTDMESPKPIECVTGPDDPTSAQNEIQNVPKLGDITDQHDAGQPATSDLKTTSLASEPPTHDPAAGPRTASLPPEHNPGAQVAGSTAQTTERPGTPSHTEAAASGIFAGQLTDSSAQITIDDFTKIELRVAQILVCERIPKADKLLRLEVDLGYEKRQILSGIAEWYTPEELIGRRIVVITNLAPRRMRGLESHGMLLAASTEGGKPYLATFADADALPLGSRLK